MTDPLAQFVAIRRPDLRSVSLERDIGDPLPLKAYAPPRSALELLEEIIGSSRSGPRLRAWNVIGPYGAGKSSFAHLVAGVLGPKGTTYHRAAISSIRRADADLARKVTTARRAMSIDADGAVIAAVTASTEPLAQALARALVTGADRYWSGRPGRKPKFLTELHALVDVGSDLEPDHLMRLLEELVEKAPIIVLLDEFGKVLEHAAKDHEVDLYVAQQVAELLSNRDASQGLVLTFQHLAFDDYARTLPPTARKEWRKVEGRYGRAVFDASSAHAIQMIAQAIDSSALPAEMHRRVETTVARIEDELRGSVPADAALGTRDNYPLDPVSVPLAASLAGQLGQHDRSLGAFLASEAPGSVAWHLSRMQVGNFLLPHDVYAYFVDAASLTDLAAGGERYREIHDRIVDARDIPKLEQDLLSAVGALNLASAGLGLKASREVLSASYVATGEASADEMDAALESLVGRGLLTYRRFAGEFRVWEGSDFEVGARVEEHESRVELSEPPRARLKRMAEEIAPPRPRVARRHSHHQRTLRYFTCRYVEVEPSMTIEAERGADGVLLLVTEGDPGNAPARTVDGRPVVAIAPTSFRSAEEAALELAAVLSVLENSPELDRDPVARREVRHRLSHAQQVFADAVEAAFDPARRDVVCVARGKPVADSSSFEELLSDLLDESYPKSAALNSEMLNRRDLTSQGAKARRELIAAMFDRSGDPTLGFSGHGPDRAMLDSVLIATGLYRERGGEFAIGTPPKTSPLWKVWKALMTWFDATGSESISIAKIYERLEAPPFGVKTGPIPVLLTAALIARSEDVMVYQDGSYIPRLGAEHLERLVKTPERFAVKRFPAETVSGALFAELAAAVGTSPIDDPAARNKGALAVLRPMISLMRGLSEHSLKTKRISGTAQAVRTALLTTREPDELLFSKLPEACGVDPMTDVATPQDAKEFASVLGEAIREISNAQAQLRDHAADVLAHAFEIPRDRLRKTLAKRAAGIERHVIEPKMRAFVLLAQDTAMDNEDWVDGLAMNLLDKPPSAWVDADITVFEAAADERGRWFRRLELLFQEQTAAAGSSRLTITHPDGSEASLLLAADSGEARSKAASELDAILDRVRNELGETADAQMLAALVERLTAGSDEGESRKAS